MNTPVTRESFVVGDISDFPPGTHNIVEVAGREIGIYNVDGAVYAVLNSCAHAFAPICRGNVTGTWLAAAPGAFDWGMEGRVLRCIAHGWEYDIATGETIGGVDRRRLRTFPVSVEDGQVVVAIRGRRRNAGDGK